MKNIIKLTEAVAKMQADRPLGPRPTAGDLRSFLGYEDATEFWNDLEKAVMREWLSFRPHNPEERGGYFHAGPDSKQLFWAASPYPREEMTISLGKRAFERPYFYSRREAEAYYSSQFEPELVEGQSCEQIQEAIRIQLYDYVRSIEEEGRIHIRAKA